MISLNFSSLIATNWVVFLWNYYLHYRQYIFHRANRRRPEKVEELITEEEYEKAQEYFLEKQRYALAHDLFYQTWTTFLFTCGFLPWVWKMSSECPIQSFAFIAFKTILDSLVQLPWDMYKIFVIEEKHGFNKQDLHFFMKDRIKNLFITIFLFAVLLASTMWTVENMANVTAKTLMVSPTQLSKYPFHILWPNFYVYMWILISAVGLVFVYIHPIYIAPWLDQFVPLPEGQLKAALEKEAASVNFPLSKILVVRGSKRSAHSNAYTYGFCKNYRIVLFDTILGDEEREKVQKVYNEKIPESKGAVEKALHNHGLNDDEVLAVVGHELGHWCLWHFEMILVMIGVNLLLMTLVFAYFCKSQALFEVFGFSSTPVVIGIILVYTFILAPYSELIKVVFNVVTRQCEFAADSFSADLGYTEQMISALKSIAKENLILPIDDQLYSICNNNHPTTLERIEALRKKK